MHRMGMDDLSFLDPDRLEFLAICYRVLANLQQVGLAKGVADINSLRGKMAVLVPPSSRPAQPPLHTPPHPTPYSSSSTPPSPHTHTHIAPPPPPPSSHPPPTTT